MSFSKKLHVLTFLCLSTVAFVPNTFAIDFHLAAKFTLSDEENRKSLGWNALSSTLSGRQKEELLGDELLIADLENRATESPSPAAIHFLESLYSERKDASRDHFESVVHSLLKETPIELKTIPGFILDQSHHHPRLEGYLAEFFPQVRDRVLEILVKEQASFTKTLAATLVARSSALQNAFFAAGPLVEKSVFSTLVECSVEGLTDVYDSLFKTVCKRSLLLLAPASQSSMATVLKSLNDHSYSKLNPPKAILGHLQVNPEVIPGSRIWTSKNKCELPVVPINSEIARQLPGFSAWKELNGLWYHSGFAFNPITIGFTNSTSLGMNSAGLGYEQCTWHKADAGGGVDLRLNISAGYQPSELTNWVAVREKVQGSMSDLRCTGGAIDPGVPNILSASDGFYTSTLLERGSSWKIYAVDPGQTLTFSANSVPAYDSQGSFFGLTFASKRQELIELIEFSPQNTAKAPHLDILDLAKRTEGSNPLLQYVAALQYFMAPGGTFLRDSGSVQIDALNAMSQIRLLAASATMDLSNTPGVQGKDTQEYAKIQWEERQNFLKLALPSVMYRMYQFYAPKLESQLVSLKIRQISYRKIESLLDQALSSTRSLAQTQAGSLLTRALTSLSLPEETSMTSWEELQVALPGAKEGISNLISEVELSLEGTCSSLLGMQPSEELRSIFLTVGTKPEILEMCAD